MIFWEHIKGLNVSGTTKAWSYINFQTTVTDNISTSTNADMTCNPTVGFGDTGYNVTNKNYILTSHMLNGYINNIFEFKQKVKWTRAIDNNAKELFLDYTNASSNDLWKFGSAQDIYFECENSTEIATLLLTSNRNNAADRYAKLAYKDTMLVLRDNTISLFPRTTGGEIQLNRKTVFDKLVCSNNPTEGDGSCTAAYFNATSDYRAKKDFKLLDINALDLINKVRLYSFKYKDSNQPSIGIIAQDVQDVNIEGFDLVDNKNATGDNFDYMSIHESKLIYILWKAIQEQQKEIEELKQQLNK